MNPIFVIRFAMSRRCDDDCSLDPKNRVCEVCFWCLFKTDNRESIMANANPARKDDSVITSRFPDRVYQNSPPVVTPLGIYPFVNGDGLQIRSVDGEELYAIVNQIKPIQFPLETWLCTYICDGQMRQGFDYACNVLHLDDAGYHVAIEYRLSLPVALGIFFSEVFPVEERTPKDWQRTRDLVGKTLRFLTENMPTAAWRDVNPSEG